MAVRIQVRRLGRLLFDDLAIGSEFLDVGDERDDLGLGEVVAQGVALEVRLVWQIDLGGDEGGGNFLGLAFGEVADFMLAHGGPRDADADLGGDFRGQGFHVGGLFKQPGIGRHVRAGRGLAGVEEVVEMPVVAALADAHVLGASRQGAALAGEVGAGALGAPLIGVVEKRLAEMGIIIRFSGAAVAHDVGNERADHLRMAVVTAFGNIQVAADEFERGVKFLETAFDVFLPVDDE